MYYTQQTLFLHTAPHHKLLALTQTVFFFLLYDSTEIILKSTRRSRRQRLIVYELLLANYSMLKMSILIGSLIVPNFGDGSITNKVRRLAFSNNCFLLCRNLFLVADNFIMDLVFGVYGSPNIFHTIRTSHLQSIKIQNESCACSDWLKTMFLSEHKT